MNARALAFALRLALILVIGSATCLADSYDDRRLRTGAKLFRALLAADLGLQDRAGTDGRLTILILASEPGPAGEVADLVSGAGGPGAGTIRGIPVNIEIAADLPATHGPVAGMFVASQKTRERVDQIARWGIAQRTIVYSPFEGHVEQGVLAGLSVEARVRPYLNRKTLEESGIHLQPFFLQVVRMHE